MRNFIKKNSTSLISIFITSVFFLFFITFEEIEPLGDKSFVVNDGRGLIYPFLVLFREKLLNGDGLLYYWNGALGDGFLPTYFFTIASPIYFLVIFFNRNQISTFLGLTIILRIVMAAGTFGFYITHKDGNADNKPYMIPLSCAYALSGFILGYYSECMWLDSYVLFPIIMYGYEKMIRDKKPHVYIISLSISAFCNFFMTYMVGIFLVIYFFTDLRKKSPEDSFFIRLKYFFCSSLISVLIAAMPIVVTLFALFKTRIGEKDTLTHEWFGSILKILRYQLPLSKPIIIYYQNDVANIFCGIFSILFLIIYFFASKDSKTNKLMQFIRIIVLLLSMNESILNYIWHGFHFQNGVPNRFSFIYIFMILDITQSVLNEGAKVKLSIIGFVLSIVFPIVLFIYPGYDSLINGNTTIILTECLVILYYIFYIIYIKKDKQLPLYILSILMTLEILLNAFVSFNNTVDSIPNYYQAFEDISQYEKKGSEDNGFHRSRVTCLQGNAELLSSIYGVSLFNGFLNTDIINFLENMGCFISETTLLDSGGFEPLDDLIGIKNNYILYNYNSDFLEYPETYSSNSFNIKTNSNALSLGYGINMPSEQLEFGKYKCAENINELINSMANYDDIFQEVYPGISLVGEGFEADVNEADYVNLVLNPYEGYSDPYIDISFEAEESGLYSILLAYQTYGKIEITINDILRRTDEIHSNGILSLGRINKGDKVAIKLSYNSLTNGLQLSGKQIFQMHLYKLNESIYNDVINHLKTNQMTIDKITDSHLYGNVTLAKSQVLFTSIPYDEGWHIFENGKELEKEKYADAFIMLNIGEGQHNLEFKYMPQGLILGAIISLLSLIAYISVSIIYSKKIASTRSDNLDE